MKIWLDDLRTNPEGWVWCRNANFAFAAMQFGCEEISLDHDLGENTPTGYDLLCVLEKKIALGEWNMPIPIFYIHSANPVGRKNMERAIESIKKLVL